MGASDPAGGARGEIVALLRRPARGGAVVLIDSADLDPEAGLVGDYSTSRKRQVTILSEEAWFAATRELGRDLPWHNRRANILIRGVDLEDSLGMRLTLGACEILIHGETKPCQVMDDAALGLRAALAPSWRGGVYGSILTGGTVRPGDRAAFA